MELKSTGRVSGDVEAPVIIVEEGVLLDGHCRMTRGGQTLEVPAPRDLAVGPLKR